MPAPYTFTDKTTGQTIEAAFVNDLQDAVVELGDSVITLNGLKTDTIPFLINGNGAPITTGVKGTFQVDYAGTIQANTLLADQSGSIAITIKKSTYAGYPGSLASIVASAKPTLSSAQKSTTCSVAPDSASAPWTSTSSATCRRARRCRTSSTTKAGRTTSTRASDAPITRR